LSSFLEVVFLFFSASFNYIPASYILLEQEELVSG